MLFGAMFVTAQQTPSKDTSKAKTEKNVNKVKQSDMKTVEPDKITADTAKATEQKVRQETTSDLMKQQRDGINDEATKPMQPAPGQTE